MIDKTSLSYWFPLISAAGVPVPKTTILEMPQVAQKCVWKYFNGCEGPPEQTAALESFINDIRQAGESVGAPFFLRTAHTSNKHNWRSACFVADPAVIGQHVVDLCEFSECAGFLGLPWDTFVVRELLPTIPFGTCPNYGGMPICREFRFFVNGGEIECSHPYWPLHALRDGGAVETLDYAELCRMPDETALRALASAAGAAVGGRWSVDILETARGWFVTDMAEAEKSYHWEGCPNA